MLARDVLNHNSVNARSMATFMLTVQPDCRNVIVKLRHKNFTNFFA